MASISEWLGHAWDLVTALNAIWLLLGLGLITLPIPYTRTIGIILIIIVVIVSIAKVVYNATRAHELLEGFELKRK